MRTWFFVLAVVVPSLGWAQAPELPELTLASIKESGDVPDVVGVPVVPQARSLAQDAPPDYVCEASVGAKRAMLACEPGSDGICRNPAKIVARIGRYRFEALRMVESMLHLRVTLADNTWFGGAILAYPQAGAPFASEFFAQAAEGGMKVTCSHGSGH